MKTKLMILVPVVVFVAFVVNAQTATPKVTKRQLNQQERISQGKKSGALTNKEAATLEMREAKVQHDKVVAKSDGVVTPAEKAKLNREENRTSRAIYRKKHNEVKK